MSIDMLTQIVVVMESGLDDIIQFTADIESESE